MENETENLHNDDGGKGTAKPVYLSASDYQNIVEKHRQELKRERLTYIVLRFVPILWCFDCVYFRNMRLISFPKLGIVSLLARLAHSRTLWMERSSWQNISIWYSRFAYFQYTLSLLVLISWIIKDSQNFGIVVNSPKSIVWLLFACVAYLLLRLLFLARCPAAIQAQIVERKRKGYMVNKRDMIRKWLHDSLYPEVRAVYLTLSDVKNITHELEREVLQHLLTTTHKRWQYDGLNQNGLRYIREIGAAVAIARKGKLYENFDQSPHWWVHENDTNVPYRISAEAAPTLYTCHAYSHNPFPPIEGFRDDVDLAIQFIRHGRNFEPLDRDVRVEHFVQGLDDLVTEQTSDTILDVVAQHESCRRKWSRVIGWLLIGAILSYTGITFIRHLMDLVPLLFT